ncbi:MAG: DUF4190 domain-containing protein, partial [Verrucomicrobiota bacterium]
EPAAAAAGSEVIQPSPSDPYQSPATNQLAPQQPQQYYYPPVAPTSTMAIVALVLGILSVGASGCYGTGIVLAVPAIICGRMARKEVARSQGTVQGDGLALAGFITGWVGVGISALWILGIGGMIAWAIYMESTMP